MTNTTVPVFDHLPVTIQQMVVRQWLDSNIVCRDDDISFRLVDYGHELADGQYAATEYQGTPLCIIEGEGGDLSLVFKSGDYVALPTGKNSPMRGVTSFEYRGITPCPFTGRHEWKSLADWMFDEHGMRVH